MILSVAAARMLILILMSGIMAITAMNDLDKLLAPVTPKRITTYRGAMDRIGELELGLHRVGAWIDGRYILAVPGTQEPSAVKDEIKRLLYEN